MHAVTYKTDFATGEYDSGRMNQINTGLYPDSANFSSSRITFRNISSR